MKIKSLVLLVIVVIFSSCTVQKFTPTDLPKKEEQEILSRDSIKKLGQSEIQKAQEMAEKMEQEKRERLAKQPKVSNIFVEASIRSVLMDISTQTGVNIIPDQTVEGSVSVQMEEVPLERALEMVLFPGGFNYKRIETGNSTYYLIGSAFPESFSFDALSETEVIKTNVDAEEVLRRLSSHFDPYVKANENGNSITITASTDMVRRIKTDIMRIDRSKRQIEISAVVAIVEWEKSSNIGMDWSNVNLDASGAIDFSGGANYTANIVGNIKNVVDMREKRASVYVKAEPRVVVSEGEEANIKLTKEHIFMIMSGGGMNYNYYTTTNIETGVKMEVSPSINRDGTIQMKITPEVADIVGERTFKMGGNGSQKLPIIARRSETTSVALENGETFALGGLIMESKKESEDGTPILGSIPLLNWIFKSKQKENKNVEMVIFITPKIIR